MNILIASALYPPDVAPPAPYVKELATRLAKKHNLTVLTYGKLPEASERVTLKTIPKRYSALRRLLLFTYSLFTLTRQHDIVLLQNAPSTELPALFVSLLYKHKLYLVISDTKISYTGWRAFFHKRITARVAAVLSSELPKERPEILPFCAEPVAAFASYETSWNQHLTHLLGQTS